MDTTYRYLRGIPLALAGTLLLGACQSTPPPAEPGGGPALVILMSVDQMRADLLYGYAPSTLSFHGGTLCVNTPKVQFPAKLASPTGSPPCSGIIKSNINKRIQSGVDPTLTAGAQVYAQWRQRDPNDPAGFGDSLTTGLTFVVQP